MMERWQRTPALAIGWNIALLVGYWFLDFVLIRVANLLPASVSRQVGEVAAGAIAVSVAFVLQARIATFVLAAFFAFSTAEFTIDTIFGPRTVHGGGAHFALLAAALIGVTLGSIALRHQTPREHSQ
jgi:hypothetical protein